MRCQDSEISYQLKRINIEKLLNRNRSKLKTKNLRGRGLLQPTTRRLIGWSNNRRNWRVELKSDNRKWRERWGNYGVSSMRKMRLLINWSIEWKYWNKKKAKIMWESLMIILHNSRTHCYISKRKIHPNVPEIQEQMHVRKVFILAMGNKVILTTWSIS